MYRLALFLVVLGVLFQLPPTWLIFIPVAIFWIATAGLIATIIGIWWLEWRDGS